MKNSMGMLAAGMLCFAMALYAESQTPQALFRCKSERTGIVDTLAFPTGTKWRVGPVWSRFYLEGDDYRYRGLCEPLPPDALRTIVADTLRLRVAITDTVPSGDTVRSDLLVVDTLRQTVTVVDTTLIASRNEKLELTGVLITLLFVGSGFLIWLWRATK